MAQQGGCVCGNVRYSIEGEPVMKALCHCLDCRKISGSAYSTNAVYPEAGFKLLQGTPKIHKKVADSGNSIASHFCPDCGSTLWRDGPGFDGLKIIKVGTLDDVNALNNANPNAELFSRSRATWVNEVPAAKQNTTMT